MTGICDIDEDDNITSADIDTLVDIVLTRTVSSLGDINHDGNVNVIDIQRLCAVVQHRYRAIDLSWEWDGDAPSGLAGYNVLINDDAPIDVGTDTTYGFTLPIPVDVTAQIQAYDGEDAEIGVSNEEEIIATSISSSASSSISSSASAS